MTGLSAHEIYVGLTRGWGPGSLEGAYRTANLEAELEADRANRIRALANKIEAGWQGQAGAAAFGAAQPLAEVTMIGASNLEVTHQLLRRQVYSFDSARANVVPVPEKPPETGFLDDISPWQTDTEDELLRHQAESEHNIRIYSQYENESWSNETALPTDYSTLQDPGGEIVVERPEQTPPRGGPGERGGVVPPGGGGREDDEVTPPILIEDEDRTRPQWVDNDTTVPQGDDSKVVHPSRTQVTPAATPPPGPAIPPQVPVGTGGGSRGGTHRGGSGPGGRPGGGPGGHGGGTGGRAGGVGPGGPRALGAALPESRSPSTDPHARGQGSGRGGMGGGGMGGGARGQGGEDEEHTRASFLQEDDPEAIFGTDEVTAPPVIGE